MSRAAPLSSKKSTLTGDTNDQLPYINRETSWLAFNERVLEEAQNAKYPLFERVRFLSISASNLDEFYMVRVAGLKAQESLSIDTKSRDGLTASEQIKIIGNRVESLMAVQQACWRDLLHDLAKEHLQVLRADQLNRHDRKTLSQVFLSDIFPVLTPLAIDPAHPFPFMPNLGLSLALNLVNRESDEVLNALVPIPGKLDRFVRIPGKSLRFILLEEVILLFLYHLFPGFEARDHGIFRVIRDSEMEIDEEAEDLVKTFETALKRRRRGRVIRLTVTDAMSPDLRQFVTRELAVTEQEILTIPGLVGLADIKELIIRNHPELVFEPYTPRFPERILDFGGDCFQAIQAKDIVVHHPYESFDVVVQFIRQAARDPNVVAIKQTLYRTSDDSPIIKALIEAAEAGKSVTAMVELKARFDEEANIRWARDLERAGAQVVYGFLHLKTHAKISLVVRREKGGLRSYVHFGTGNYHPITAKIYTDVSFFTCDPELCLDAAIMFNYMTGYAVPQNLTKLALAPLNLRTQLFALIDEEIYNARQDKPAQIWIKLNSLVDQSIIAKLYEASAAGVKIELIIRGICCLQPGLPGISENIRVKSLVGRFLEHSRIICFANGQELPSRKAKLFISSADWMERNFDWRIETLVPITNPTVHRQLLEEIMIANLLDNENSWSLHKDGSYHRITPDQGYSFSAHSYFMNNPSLSGRGSALDDEKHQSLLSAYWQNYRGFL